MPISDADLEFEYGLPEAALKLKLQFLDVARIFIDCPEYNSPFGSLLKNIIDWLSRPHQENEAPLFA